MALRIACDLDGTLADLEGALQREAERLFGPDVDLGAGGHVDRPENCLDVTTDSRARSILIWRDDPHTTPAAAATLGITVVHSFGEALDDLQTLTTTARSGGLVSRLRAAIGI